MFSVQHDAVLMLSTSQPSNVPMVIGTNGKLNLFTLFIRDRNTWFIGEIDDDINFTMGANTEAYGSCATSFNNEMYVFGDHSERRQIRFEYHDRISLIVKQINRWAQIKILSKI